jgi:hypothetical protein
MLERMGYWTLATLIALGLCCARPAAAGQSDFLPVAIAPIGNRTIVYGSLGSTRNDLADANQYLRCTSSINDGQVTGFPPDMSGKCEARKGIATASCSFPPFGQIGYQLVLSTITSDALIGYTFDNGTKLCDSLLVQMSSANEPKLL